MQPLTAIYDACDDLLGACQEILACIDRPTDRAFVALCDPPLDCCDQLTVHADVLTRLVLTGSGPGATLTGPGTTPSACATKSMCDLVTRIHRCIPVPDNQGNPPPPTVLDAASAALYGDVFTLWAGVMEQIRDGRLFDGDACGRAIAVNPAHCVIAEGGCGGWEFSVTVELDVPAVVCPPIGS